MNSSTVGWSGLIRFLQLEALILGWLLHFGPTLLR